MDGILGILIDLFLSLKTNERSLIRESYIVWCPVLTLIIDY
jgi:hypothetical protein